VSAYDLTSNPLAEYLASLDTLRGIEPAEVLPAHEYRFTGLDSRLDYLAGHHRERLAEAEAGLVKAGPAGTTAWQAATEVTWSRPWEALASFQRQAAVGEVISHLRYLQSHGRAAEADAGGVGIWTAPA
jgi:glyoxylase-like metal-dependent hydrolase (beta-lactamase superfamily II)